jgi:putative Mg2+ transporter-C (MgtC) family protein
MTLYTTAISEGIVDALVKLGIAFALSFVIGFERELRHKPAGIRTHVLVCLGSTLFTIISYQAFPQDPARIASNIATGIGFIGAGVIMKAEDRVVGLTTAASLWLTAAIGLAIGLGLYTIATIATTFGLLTLLLKPVEDLILKRKRLRKAEV